MHGPKLEKLLLPLLLLATVLTSCLFINSKDVNFGDELLFEETSFRMAKSGNFLTPVLKERNWLEKPPLYFWLTAPVFHVANLFTKTNVFDLGQSLDSNNIFKYPWIRRFWTEVAALVCVFFTYKITKLLSDRKSALLAGLVLLTSPLFFFATLSASLDICFTAAFTVSIFLYLGIVKEKTLSNSKPLLLGLSLSACILFRSILAFTPFALIAVDQVLKPKKLPLSAFLKVLVLVALIVLPWHIYQFIQNRDLFFRIYLGFNLVDHALNLTPGYQETTPFYYLKTLFQNPWFYITLPFWYLLAAKILHRLFKLKLPKFKKIENILSLSLQKNQIIVFWLFIPAFSLSFASTRHFWYLIQAAPAAAILSGQIGISIYKFFDNLKNQAGKYFLQIAFLACSFVPFAVLFSFPNHNATLVNILDIASAKMPKDKPIYELPLPFFPQTLLYHPQNVKQISIGELKSASQTQPFYVFIDSQNSPQALQILPNLKLVYQYPNVGNLYKLP